MLAAIRIDRSRTCLGEDADQHTRVAFVCFFFVLGSRSGPTHKNKSGRAGLNSLLVASLVV